MDKQALLELKAQVFDLIRGQEELQLRFRQFEEQKVALVKQITAIEQKLE